MGASSSIGFSADANRILVMIAFPDADGDLHDINACPATGADLRFYREGTTEGERLIRLWLRALHESEQTREAAYPAGARPTRPNRDRGYSLRLSEEEQARVQQVADARHLPASTLVRSWILDRLDQRRSPEQRARALAAGWSIKRPIVATRIARTPPPCAGSPTRPLLNAELAPQEPTSGIIAECDDGPGTRVTEDAPA